MADTVDKIINFEMKYSDLVNGLKKINTALAQNKATLQAVEKEYKNSEASADGYLEKQIELKAQNKALTEQMKVYEKEIQNNIKIETQQSNSIKALRAEYAKQKNTFEEMSAEMRNSDAGKKAAEDLFALKTQLNESEESMGIFNGRVGSYEAAIKNALPINNQFLDNLLALPPAATAAGGGMKGYVTVIGQATKASLAFIATPIGAALATIGAAIALVKNHASNLNDTITSSESLMNSYAKATSLAQAYEIERIKALQDQTKAWIKFKKAISDTNTFVKSAFSNIVNSNDVIARKKELDALIPREQAFIETRRAFVEEEATIEKEIAELREVSKDQLNYTNEERNAAIVKAQELNEQLGASRKTIAQEEADIYSMRIALTGSTADQLDREAELKAKVINIDKQTADSNRTMQRTVTETTNAIKAENAALLAEEEAKKAALQASKDYEQQVQSELKTLTLSLYEKSAEVEKAILADQTANEIAEIQKRIETDDTLTTAAKEALNGKILLLQEKLVKDQAAVDQQYSKEALDKAVAAKQAQYTREQQELALDIAKVKAMLMDDPDNPGLQLQLQLYNEQQGTQQLNNLRTALTELQNMSEEHQKLMFDSEEDYRDALLDAELAYTNESNRLSAQRIAQTQRESAAAIQIRQAELQATGQILGGISSLFETLGSDNREMLIASQILAIAEIAIQQGIAIANATRAATQASFNPWVLAANIVTAVAAVTASIAQAVQSVKSAEFSKGGYVDAANYYADGGLVTGIGTTTSDSIPAMLSNGESVMTAQATADWGAVLSMMNVESGGNAINTSNLPVAGDGTAGMERMMQRVFASMPPSVLSIKDLYKAEQRVEVQGKISRLG